MPNKLTQRVVNIALTVVLVGEAATWTDEEVNNFLKIKSADRKLVRVTSCVLADEQPA
jgi:hypothetical protein